MFIEIIAPEKKLYSGEISLVQLPGKKSPFEVLTHHAHIISTLTKGRIRLVDLQGAEKSFLIEGGIMENHDNKIIVLVELSVS